MGFVSTWFRAAAVRPGSARPYGRTSPALEYPAARAARTASGVGRYADGKSIGSEARYHRPLRLFCTVWIIVTCTQSLSP